VPAHSLDVLDIVLGALDAHLALSKAENWRTMNRNKKLRTAILLVFSATSRSSSRG